MTGRREVGNVLVDRPVPIPDAFSAFFWTSGADGKLRMLRCAECGHISHPPGPRCKHCYGTGLAPDTMCGTGRVVTFTVNHQSWGQGQEPYIIAMVELDDQPHLWLETNLVGIDDGDIELDIAVRVVFEAGPDGIWYPLFAPVGN